MKQKQVEKTVKEILEQNEYARKDDHILYSEYLTEKSDTGILYSFLHYKELGIASFESVSRARRRVQTKYPELRADKDTEHGRLKREAEFYSEYSKYSEE